MAKTPRSEQWWWWRPAVSVLLVLKGVSLRFDIKCEVCDRLVFIKLWKFLSIPHFLGAFIINRCWIISKFFKIVACGGDHVTLFHNIYTLLHNIVHYVVNFWCLLKLLSAILFLTHGFCLSNISFRNYICI